MVATYLLNDLDWERVEASDISDIAYDACIEARSNGGRFGAPTGLQQQPPQLKGAMCIPTGVLSQRPAR
jgi:hypothetical protein